MKFAALTLFISIAAAPCLAIAAEKKAEPKQPDPAYCAQRDADPKKCVIQDGPPRRHIARKKPAPKTPANPASPAGTPAAK